ncbi:bifunctional alpha/beta hydrolase/OsmC family protein [Rubricoccus marinus]|uniref:Osmotically inducible protein C n=1 Tax=Rubricoccus marinus TaxID=716817 RepID=A0A259TYL9_9BACT|nr:bifunctional alpha/beta hydrolase/OsmC family protein [Rubricoccus marinus]OZC02678.1 osmotically inducible protein C [Rubricoccus marinus]
MPRQERFEIENADGHALAARLLLPDGEVRATALFAHCFTCSKDLHAVRRVSQGLTAHGYAVLSFDFTGLGESEGDFADTSFSSTVADLVHAARHLGARGLPPSLLVGHSLGGAAVLAAAGALPKVRAVATIGAPCDPGHIRHLFVDREADIAARGEAEVSIGGRPFCIRQQFLDDLASHQTMRERIAALGRPLLVLHSPMDQTVGIEQARHIFGAARHPKSFVALDGADHLLTRREDAAFVADVLAAWAARYLGIASGERPTLDQPPRAYADPTVRAHLGASGFRTVMRARGFKFAADEPTSIGGTETAPTPYDYLGAALAACTAMTLRMYAGRKGLPMDSVDVTVTHAKVHAEDCANCEASGVKLDRLTRTITIHGDLTGAQRQRLLEIADRCPVHRTLESEIDVVTIGETP